MGLFKRKRGDDEAPEMRCPQCNEPVPEGALECMMCGADLRSFRPDDAEPVEANSTSR
jgi:hypothetical protein